MCCVTVQEESYFLNSKKYCIGDEELEKVLRTDELSIAVILSGGKVVRKALKLEHHCEVSTYLR